MKGLKCGRAWIDKESREAALDRGVELSSTLKNRRILVLGTAPNQEISACLDSFNGDDVELHLLILESRKAIFRSSCISTHGFKGRLSWYKLSLLATFLRLRPSRLICLRNNGAAADFANVIRLVHFWKFFDSRLKVIWMQGATVRPFFLPNPQSFGVLAIWGSCLMGISCLGLLFPQLGMGLIVGILLGEGLLWLFDRVIYYQDQVRTARSIEIQHKGESGMMPDDELGWCNLPKFSGKRVFSISGLAQEEHQFQVTHDEDGRRITEPVGIERGEDRSVISVYGCSISYGQGVDDDESYPWRLQQRFGDYRVLNYGVGGWSLYQVLLRMEATLANDRPRVVVLGFHQELALRCTNSYGDRLYWLDTMENPACVYKDGRLHRYAPKSYRFLPFSQRSRLLKVVEYGLNRLAVRGRGDRQMIRETTEYLLGHIRALCSKYDSRLLVACVHDSEQYYGFFNDERFSWCINNVPSDPAKWTLFPYDTHPNAAAHARNSEVIGDALERLLAGYNVTPDAERLAGHMAEPVQNSETPFIYPQY